MIKKDGYEELVSASLSARRAYSLNRVEQVLSIVMPALAALGMALLAVIAAPAQADRGADAAHTEINFSVKHFFHAGER